MENLGKPSVVDHLFRCETCNFTTTHRHNYLRHCQSLKHCQNCKTIENPKTKNCSKCDREFMSESGLWKHIKRCKSAEEQKNEVVVDILMKQNQEYKDMLLNQNKEHTSMILKKDEDFKSIILEICKNTQTIQNTLITGNTNNSNNNNNNNSHNNTSFNLQVFLNDTCKEALNLSEFIQNVKFDFEDIQTIGNMGYIDGLSEIITRNLNALGIHKRPIHCTDPKRNTLYVKEDDKWDKEDENMFRIFHFINEMQRANLRKLQEWKKLHPSCLTSNSIYTDNYNKMSHELMGGDCNGTNMTAKDTKILHKIAKGVTIDKTKMALLQNIN